MVVKPFISVIIPVYNAQEFLNQCLAAIKESSYTFYEVIVVDDGSTDGSSEIARKSGAKVFRMQYQSGPAVARNYGAQKAKGQVLLFIDSDVLVKEQTLARVAKDFTENPDIAAVFGSYDDEPAKKNFLSQYKNLIHHYVHQRSNSEAVTFWAGCGAIRKAVFHVVGGFDGKKYARPCIEDIELGYRLKRMGYRILLDKDLQVKHLKEWRLKSWLRTDIFSRAVPWTKLILESQEMVDDLNLQLSQKMSAILLGLSLLALTFSFISHQLLYVVVISLVLIFLINHKLFAFFFKLKGIKFVILAFFSQLLYYFYSSVVFVSCWCNYKFLRKIVS